MQTQTWQGEASSKPSFPFFDNRDNQPIRAELYGLDALETHARQLAAVPARLQARPQGLSLLQRFHQNGRVLDQVHRRIVAVVQSGESLIPAAEWLLDNYYIIQDILPEVRQDLPRGYYRELPKLINGPLAGYPRIYALAVGMIAHTDSNVSEFHLIRFVQAYQSVAPLSIGELWAVPTMFRLALLENLRRLSEQLLEFWAERHQADAWFKAQALDQPGAHGPRRTLPLPATNLTDPFLVRLLQLLREFSPSEDVLDEYERVLANRGIDIAQVVQHENYRQASDQVSVGNAITSLRLLSALDWKVFFEQTSLVEPILRQDPAGIYPQQDFGTRDRFRRSIERLARRSRRNEQEVACQVVDLAGRHRPEASPQNHIGYYLVGEGREKLEIQIHYRPAFGERLLRAMLHHPHATYFGGIGLLLVAGLALVLVLASLFGSHHQASPLLWVALVLAAVLPVSDLAVGLTNFLLSLFLPPRVLAKLEFREGIPPDCTTFVALPTMLVQTRDVRALLEKIEIHYLSNPDPQLRFALLTDFADAPQETMPQDAALLQAALEGIRCLNERYPSGQSERFFLFHRKRVYNPGQHCWMGWERKRGKLTEFNRLIRGARDTTYVALSGDPAGLPRIRYVITLDADTQMPREEARRLIGTLAHPLNRPHFDPKTGRVIRGYAILQPRISFHMPAARRSLFTRIWANSAGIDPYSTAVSDIYQDLFGAGTYTGKGIYDLDVFMATLADTFPENSILSHDLIEGNFAHCGLVTDIQLYDEFPVRYNAYTRREHRWARGDWQLLPWLGPTVPTAGVKVQGAGGREQQRQPNRLPCLERLKVLDNLRRSLMPPAIIVMLTLGWLLLPGSAWLWTGLAGAILTLPLLMQACAALINTARTRSITSLAEFRKNAPATLGQVLLTVAFLMNQAHYLLDAIVRTLWRLLVSRQWLLEWETSASAERRLGVNLWIFFRDMWLAPVLAAALGLVVWLVQPQAFPAACPFLVAWLFSPVVAFWVSRPLKDRDGVAPLSVEAVSELRRVARRTWGFFETFVSEDNHWLPPDNFQEVPRPQIANRTSPTNLGMFLLSTLAAHDLGYLSLNTLLGRLEKTIDTLERLERHRGHFVNWYDTVTLQPLQPPYISTVDSGNLLGCLLALKQGLYEKAETVVVGPGLVEGLGDTLALMTQSVEDQLPQELQRSLDEIQGLLRIRPDNLLAWEEWLEHFSARAGEMARQVRALTNSETEPDGEPEVWSKRLAETARDGLEELHGLAPWLNLPSRPGLMALPLGEFVDDGHTWSDLENLEAEREFFQAWDGVRQKLIRLGSVKEWHQARGPLMEELIGLENAVPPGPNQAGVVAWLAQVREAVKRSTAGELLGRIHGLAGRADTLARAMDFTFLYKSDRHLFSIVYHLDTGRLEPGYIKGYVPGIRENGGQYTHAAVWMVEAVALTGQGTQAVGLFDLLNPIHHTLNPADVGRYKVEPYVLAADVYRSAMHLGRGGWTWYTGSASWFYRVALEYLLGFRLKGARLEVDPCIAAHWPHFEIFYCHGSAHYHVVVENPHGVERGVETVWLDGQALEEASIPLADDGCAHQVRVVLGRAGR